MDTISVKLRINYKGRVLDKNVENYIEDYINKIKSPYGYKYCDYLEMDKDKNIIIKISYPRYYGGINAFLISNSEQCLEVQRDLIKCLRYEGFQYEVLDINLIRLDIPFTFQMACNRDFNEYRNIFVLLAHVYQRKNPSSDPKMIGRIIGMELQTLIYTDTRVTGNYNSKIMIYNQYQNLQDKYTEMFESVLQKYDDLSKRMRLEVSKRINRMPFTVNEFSCKDLYGEYLPKYKKYILENFFDVQILEELYSELALELAEKLRLKRNGGINYEVFIVENIDRIYDYEILRRAINMVIENTKTKEAAITRVRKILNGYEEQNGIILMNTYISIQEIKSAVMYNY